jgi:preprotein translocase subunit SecA
VAAAHQAFAAKVEQIGAEQFVQFERMVLLQTIDTHWREHLSALDYLRQGIHLRGYAQKQPKQEYKREAFELFSQLLDSVRNEVTRVLMTVQVQSPEQLDQAAAEIEQRGERVSNITYTAPDESGAPQVTAEDAARLQSFLESQSVARVGRNDPCPCGSGKKYKLCHGRLS